MEASADDDNRRVRGAGEAVSAWSRRTKQQIWDCLRDDKISVFSVWGWQGVGKSRIMRQVAAAAMEEYGESSRLFDVFIRVRAPGVESLGEKMQASVIAELDRFNVDTQVRNARSRAYDRYDDVSHYPEASRYLPREYSIHNQQYMRQGRSQLLEIHGRGRRNRLMEVQIGIQEALEIPKSMNFFTAAKQISDKLRGQRFLLVLEDVWESMYLEDMGVPVAAPATASSNKVVITTRSHEVCSVMGAQVNIEPVMLSEEDAWDILQEEATDVATSIGFSTGDMVLKCFSYVSLLCRKGISIDGDSLIEEYWRSEGFIDVSFIDDENKEATLKRLGNVLLKELGERCMLVVSSAEEKELFTVNLEPPYDVDLNSDVKKVIDSRTSLVKYNLNGEEACQWISLSHNQVETLQFPSPNCPLLSTLLLNDNLLLQEIPDTFFVNMTRLHVLDLSSTSISSLPSSMIYLSELRLLKIQSCHNLDALPMFLMDMQKLEILDLHQTPLTKMVVASFDNMQSLRSLNISGARNLCRLSLKGCHSLMKLISPDKDSKLEEIYLLGTKMEELPHNIFNLTSMRRLDLLGMEHLKTIEWRKIDRLPEELNWDRCGLNLLHQQLQDTSRRCISVSDASVFGSLDKSSQLWKSCFRKFHFLVCPCEGGRKDMYGRFKRNQFLYHRIYAQFEKSLSYERCLEVCGGKNFLNGITGVLSVTEFFHLYCNEFVKVLTDLSMEMDNLKECWIEKCHQLECLIVGRIANIDVVRRLENLRVSDLAMLKTVCRGRLGRGSFAWLKHIHLECCPKLVNFFSSSIRLQKLELLEIKFCCRLEKVFEEDNVAGKNAFPLLVEFRLWELCKLKSICGGHLPMLKKLKIQGCPRLKKLPLQDMNDSAVEVEIEGELKWWESIKWEGNTKPLNIRFKEWCPSKKIVVFDEAHHGGVNGAQTLLGTKSIAANDQINFLDEAHNAVDEAQTLERDPTEAMADDDDRRLKGGGEVSAWSRLMRQQIWDCLRDDSISVFSVRGWKGVGRSKLVRQAVAAAMEEFEESSRLFDVIIRVRVPRENSFEVNMPKLDNKIDSLQKANTRLSIPSYERPLSEPWKTSEEHQKEWDARERRNRLKKVQKGIQEALEIPNSIDFSTASNRISAKLSGQRFLLILEDVWETMDLKEIGVPDPTTTTGVKVMITTQSQEVSSGMGVQVDIIPGELSEEDAWDFLQDEAADVATSIGFSTGDMVMKCFCYASLLCRNRASIDSDSLIEEYWRSEGFLDGSFIEDENKEESFKRLGNVLLEALGERSILLVSSVGSSGGQYHVRMDSDVRKVIDSRTSLVKYNLDGEERCQWISLSLNQVETLQFPSPSCPLLSTLLLDNNHRLQEIPDGFFEKMTRLRVLDLSSTSISSLPSSMSYLVELRLLKLQSCHKLDALPMFLMDMQKLEILDLHQTPLTKMEVASFDNLQSLRRLNISGACNLIRLSLKGCRSLLTLVSPDKGSKLEELYLSATTMEELPYNIFNLTSMQRLDLLGMEHLKTVDWRKIDRLPKELNWDRCGLNLLHQQFQDTSRRCISVSDASVFEFLDQNSKLWKSCFLKFHFLVCSCKGGRKDIYSRFKRSRFLYHRIYARFEQSLSYERRLEVCGGKNSLNGIEGVLSVAEFFYLYGNDYVKALSDLGMEMGHLKECLIEKCHQLECLIVRRAADVNVVGCLENLRVSDLAKLRTVCRGELGRGSFACLKHIHLECCPKLINFFSSNIRLQKLELLKIKFCCRLEKIFEEDGVMGQNAFPRLVEFHLWELRKLKSICGGHLPMLKKLKIRGCPMLEKLPLCDTNASAAKVEIQGEQKWWESLKWEGSIKPRNIRFKEWRPSTN